MPFIFIYLFKKDCVLIHEYWVLKLFFLLKISIEYFNSLFSDHSSSLHTFFYVKYKSVT